MRVQLGRPFGNAKLGRGLGDQRVGILGQRAELPAELSFAH